MVRFSFFVVKIKKKYNLFWVPEILENRLIMGSWYLILLLFWTHDPSRLLLFFSAYDFLMSRISFSFAFFSRLFHHSLGFFFRFYFG